MNFIDRSAHFFAVSIRKHNPNAASETALKYALSLLINTIVAFIVTYIICFFTSHVAQVTVGIVAFLFIRYFSGGLHMSSSLSCCIFTIGIFVILGHVDFPYHYAGYFCDAASIAIFFKTAPNGIENVSRIKPKYYPLLKWICMVTAASNFFIQSPVFSAAFLMQAVLTTTPAYNLRDFVERRSFHES
ncbi:accessory gene regulator B family protein [Paenibacillus thalictri]|uniref:Accessory regulator AgrB n=1 Tax=Paenibacillus thalictri TaxID=2527873 RepID=A0A4Q9DYK6_9BACL|nr:accessory gene regulator B family protein [Paenibacillus thalictri]TBL81190.1 hypothetical protein EYB31_03615 [Paenibacillus thalictri]